MGIEKGFERSLNGSKSLIFLPYLAPAIDFDRSEFVLTKLKVPQRQGLYLHYLLQIIEHLL